MGNRIIKLAKPLYESVPYAYLAIGALCVAAAYVLAGKTSSDFALGLGVISTLAGVVLLLRRREYRATRARYSGGPLRAVNSEDR